MTKKSTKTEKRKRINGRVDITGEKFYYWTAIELDMEKIENDKYKDSHWICECDCGNRKTIRAYTLTKGKSAMSCGCIKPTEVSINMITENKIEKRFESTWRNMISRCTNPNSNSYDRYGEKGITVSEEWLSFERFKEDMFDDYLQFETNYGFATASIDRIDNRLGYSIDNCRWASALEQSRNRAYCIQTIVKGKEYGTLTELQEDYPYMLTSTMQSRYERGVRGDDLIKPTKDKRTSHMREESQLQKLG